MEEKYKCVSIKQAFLITHIVTEFDLDEKLCVEYVANSDAMQILLTALCTEYSMYIHLKWSYNA